MILEIAANAITTLSIWLAVRNSIHTWTTGIVGCILFLILFYNGQLYADATLQVFFVITSIIGVWQWRTGTKERAITRTSPTSLSVIGLVAVAITIGYGALLKHFTNDFMPFTDATVMILSVIAQCLLMNRKIESWPFWIATNTASVVLYLYRGMNLTAILYTAYWFNAWYGLYQWRKLCQKE